MWGAQVDLQRPVTPGQAVPVHPCRRPSWNTMRKDWDSAKANSPAGPRRSKCKCEVSWPGKTNRENYLRKSQDNPCQNLPCRRQFPSLLMPPPPSTSGYGPQSNSNSSLPELGQFSSLPWTLIRPRSTRKVKAIRSVHRHDPHKTSRLDKAPKSEGRNATEGQGPRPKSRFVSLFLGVSSSSGRAQ
jgi:hypothetical protein